MAAIPVINIVASKRVPFDETIPDYRGDYTGATPLLEIRPEPGGQGAALVSMGASSSGGQGVAITYDPARSFAYAGVTYTGASLIRLIVNETTLEGLAYSADPADPVTLHYDLHLTPVSGKKFVVMRGMFMIDPGVSL